MNELEELLQGMIYAGVLDARREYMPSDLIRAYGLDEDDAFALYNMIQNKFKS